MSGLSAVLPVSERQRGCRAGRGWGELDRLKKTVSFAGNRLLTTSRTWPSWRSLTRGQAKSRSPAIRGGGGAGRGRAGGGRRGSGRPTTSSGRPSRGSIAAKGSGTSSCPAEVGELGLAALADGLDQLGRLEVAEEGEGVGLAVLLAHEQQRQPGRAARARPRPAGRPTAGRLAA